jgi:hypothetical protein
VIATSTGSAPTGRVAATPPVVVSITLRVSSAEFVT